MVVVTRPPLPPPLPFVLRCGLRIAFSPRNARGKKIRKRKAVVESQRHRAFCVCGRAGRAGGVLAQSRVDELLTAKGKTKLKEDLLHALQERIPALEVEEVYFTEFLIQR